MATLIQITDAVRASIAAATLSQSVDCIRKYVPNFDMKDVATDLNKVMVWPRGLVDELAGRGGSIASEVTIEVGLVRRLETWTDSTEPTSTIDGLVTLLEEIGNLFRVDSPTGVNARWLKTEPVNDSLYDTEKLRNNQVFVGVIRLTFKATK